MKNFYGKAYISIKIVVCYLIIYAVFLLVASLAAPNTISYERNSWDYAVGSER